MTHRMRSVHYSQLGYDPPDAPHAANWNAFLNAMPGLLEDGHAGRFALFYGAELRGIWDTFEETIHEGLRLFGVQNLLVQQILEWVPVRFSIRTFLAPCSSSSPIEQTKSVFPYLSDSAIRPLQPQ